jgi:phosphate transport system substrate-binding protein
MNKIFLALPAAALLVACGSQSGNQGGNAAGGTSGTQVTGAGSTFVYPALSAWATDYRNQTGTAVNYQSIGSGGGISQVEAGTVDFGATDQPLASDELAKNNLAQFRASTPVSSSSPARSSPTSTRARSRTGTTRRS